MTTRDRWTIYPLLFLAIGLGLTACLQGQADHAVFEGQLVRSKRLEADEMLIKKLEGEVVVCKELLVVNESGKVVAEVTTNKSGAGLMQTANSNGAFQVVLTADPAGGVLRTLAVNGQYFQFPPADRRPLPAQPDDAAAAEPAAEPAAEQQATKGDAKAEK